MTSSNKTKTPLMSTAKTVAFLRYCNEQSIKPRDIILIDTEQALKQFVESGGKLEEIRILRDATKTTAYQSKAFQDFLKKRKPQASKTNPFSSTVCRLIGVDPGATTGICTLDTVEGKIVEHGSYTNDESAKRYILQQVALVKLENREGEIVVLLESVHKDKTAFIAGRFIKSLLGSPSFRPELRGYPKKRHNAAINAACKRSRDSGMAAGRSASFEAFCEYHQIRCVCISPSERDNLAGNPKNKQILKGAIKDRKSTLNSFRYPTKITQADFRLLTDYKKRTNEHVRDAGTLVWGYYMAHFASSQGRTSRSLVGR